MIGSPWNIILTILFLITLAICVGDLIAAKRSGDKPDGVGSFSTREVIDIGHIVMSIAMIGMTWSMENATLMWIQVAVFVLLALALVPSFIKARGEERIDIGTHIALDAAMIWMLAAMPLLMAGPSHQMGGEGMDMSGMDSMSGGMGSMPMGTPMWVTVINWGFVILSAIVALWWLRKAVRSRDHRLHSICHVLMGVGMAIMLVLMDAA